MFIQIFFVISIKEVSITKPHYTITLLAEKANFLSLTYNNEMIKTKTTTIKISIIEHYIALSNRIRIVL